MPELEEKLIGELQGKGVKINELTPEQKKPFVEIAHSIYGEFKNEIGEDILSLAERNSKVERKHSRGLLLTSGSTMKRGDAMMKSIFLRIKHVRKIQKNIFLSSMALSITVIFFQVVMRYVFKNSLTWSEELARYIFFGSAG